MKIGEQILKLRKDKKLSQEELAELVGVARQTISKWELDETSPDLKQAKELSKIFQVSLDELVHNDIQNILVTKVSNTEKLAGLVIKILKVFGIIIIIYFILMIIGIICFTAFRKESKTKSITNATVSCNIDKSDYLITVGSDGYFNCSNCNSEMQIDIKQMTDYNDLNNTVEKIEKYFTNKGGSCK